MNSAISSVAEGHDERPMPLAGNSAVPCLTKGVWVLIALALATLQPLAD